MDNTEHNTISAEPTEMSLEDMIPLKTSKGKYTSKKAPTAEQKKAKRKIVQNSRKINRANGKRGQKQSGRF